MLWRGRREMFQANASIVKGVIGRRLNLQQNAVGSVYDPFQSVSSTTRPPLTQGECSEDVLSSRT
jgi:hypothetical protein